MDFKKVLTREHSKVQTGKIADYVGSNPARFKSLVKVFADGPYRITQRAAWPLSICIENHPSLINPHYKTLLGLLGQSDVHDAVKRNITRLLQFVNIPKRYRGIAANHCFNLLSDTSQAVAVRVFSMSVLANIAWEEPELKKELRIIIENQLPYASAGFRSRGRKVLKKIQE